MIDQLILLTQGSWWTWMGVAAVAGIICCMIYATWYHLWKYPNGKPKTKK